MRKFGKMGIRTLLLAGMGFFAQVSFSEEGALADTEVWNEGVGFYVAGDVTNALRVLRPLMLSKDYSARAAEVVAKLEHERGNREEAASAAQIALRANPRDGKANRNFTRATDGLLEARRTKHINDILAASKGKDAGALLAAATADARRLLLEAGVYRTNAAPEAVRLSDAYRGRAERLADAWIPVREAIVQSVTNEEQATTILQQLATAEARTHQASVELGDLADGAYGSVGAVEHDFTRFLKLTALPPLALDEDLVAQSNAWQDVEAVNGRAWQRDALDFTRTFRAKFPMWARAYEQQAQANTNMPPFKAEDQAKISALATELEKVQLECCEQHLPPSQEAALDLIRQIQALLPKNSNSSSGSSPQEPPPQQAQQPPPQDEPQAQPKPEQSEANQEEQPQDRPEDSPKAQEEDADLEAVMKKAQERNDEHEAEKRARMRNAPLPPNERDW